MTHTCSRCWSHTSRLGELKRGLHQAIRVLENRPGTPQATRARDLIPTLKAQLADQERRYDEHLAEVPDEPETPRRVRDVAKPAKKAAPKPKKTVVIDREALAETNVILAELAAHPERVTGIGTNTLPATGHCHKCDKAISGERRFCGRCMAGRI